MKRILTLVAVCFALSISAQTIQKGIVKEYNETAQKTPLAGVELSVRSANSEVSDNAGNFSLQFLTLKPGEKVNVRRIEKLGYEVFNKEAIEQWNLNPNTPFVIVMCRSDRFKKIRDNYEKVSSESYARQLKKEEASLLKLKEQGKLKDEEYQKQLYELRENYEKQLDNLETYVDRFSRIDLSELSAVEQEIIAMVQEGKIEEAIAKYEEQNYVDRYAREVADIKEVSSAIDRLSEVRQTKEASKDSLLAAIDRQVETLRLAGGKENFDRIKSILHDVAYADTTDLELIKKFYEFAHNQKDYKSSIACLNIIINARDKEGVDDMSNAKRVVVRRNLGELYLEMDNYSDAEKYLLQSMDLCLDTIWTNSYVPNTLYRYSEELLGRVYTTTRKFDKAKELLDKGLVRRQNNYIEENSEDNLFELINILNQLANFYVNVQDFKEAFDCRTQAYHMLTQAESQNDKDYSESKSTLASDLGATCYYLNDIEAAIKYMTEAYDYRQKQAEINPDRYLPLLAQSQGNLGNLYSLINNYDKSHRFYEESYENFKKLYENDSTAYSRQYVMGLYNLASSYKDIGDSEKFLEFGLKTKDEVKKLYNSNPNAYIKFYIEALTGCGIGYHNTGKFEDELQILLHAKEIIMPYYEKEKKIYSACLLDLLSELALAYKALNEFQLAVSCFSDAIKIGDEMAQVNENSFVENRLSPWHGYISMLYDLNKYEKVMEIGEEALARFGNSGHSGIADIYVRMIKSLINLGREENAQKLYEAAIQVCPILHSFAELKAMDL